MAYEMRPDSGSIFKNDRKQSDNHPDYKGQALIGGVEYWVSAWLKTSNNGTKFMSFSYTPKDKQQSGSQRGGAEYEPVATEPGAGIDDEIPF